METPRRLSLPQPLEPHRTSDGSSDTDPGRSVSVSETLRGWFIYIGTTDRCALSWRHTNIRDDSRCLPFPLPPLPPSHPFSASSRSGHPSVDGQLQRRSGRWRSGRRAAVVIASACRLVTVSCRLTGLPWPRTRTGPRCRRSRFARAPGSWCTRWCRVRFGSQIRTQRSGPHRV